MLRQLARFHDVHAVVFQRSEELDREGDGYERPDNVRVYTPHDTPPPKTVFDRLPARAGPGLHYRWLRRSWRGPAGNELLRSHHLVKSILREHPIDAVVFEHLSTMAAAPLVKRLSPNTVRILDAHNVDHLLMEQNLQIQNGNHWTREQRKTLASVKRTEHNLGKSVEAFFACSDEDRRTLESCAGIRGYTVPNGVDTGKIAWKPPVPGNEKRLLFCGSLGYEPNMDGLKWFGEDIWPQVKETVPGVVLTVIGRGNFRDAYGDFPDDPQVNWVGEVDTTLPYYQEADILLCPLRMGSGTRLKILEAMSAGTPVVATRAGVEGINAIGGEHLLVGDSPEDFAAAVTALLNDHERRAAISRAGRELVCRSYDWNVSGGRMAEAIEQLMSTRGA